MKLEAASVLRGGMCSPLNFCHHSLIQFSNSSVHTWQNMNYTWFLKRKERWKKSPLSCFDALKGKVSKCILFIQEKNPWQISGSETSHWWEPTLWQYYRSLSCLVVTQRLISAVTVRSIRHAESGLTLLSTSDSLLCFSSRVLTAAYVILSCSFHTVISW